MDFWWLGLVSFWGYGPFVGVEWSADDVLWRVLWGSCCCCREMGLVAPCEWVGCCIWRWDVIGCVVVDDDGGGVVVVVVVVIVVGVVVGGTWRLNISATSMKSSSSLKSLILFLVDENSSGELCVNRCINIYIGGLVFDLVLLYVVYNNYVILDCFCWWKRMRTRRNTLSSWAVVRK